MRHNLSRFTSSCILFLLCVPSVFSQFLTTAVSRHEWGISDPSRIEVAQVSVIRGANGDTLLIYALRDSIPALPEPKIQEKTPDTIGKFYVISDFAYSQVNTLCGVFDTFEGKPSSSNAGLAETKDGDRVLNLAFDRRDKGYCGLWIQLFNSFDPVQDRVYLNAKPYAALSFWIRGMTGRESFTLKVADARWIQKEDAVAIGDVGSFVRGGKIDTCWRPAVIPLNKIPAVINRAQLASFVFEADSSAKGRVELKTLALCMDSATIPPLVKATAPLSPDGTQKAIWVWNTKTIAVNRETEHLFVDFLVRQHFTEVFLAIPYEQGAATETGSMPVNRAVLSPIVSLLHAKGIRVHALIGDRNFALPQWHSYATSTVENIIRFNAESKRLERFDGIHLDVEPYLLPGFNSPRHGKILEGYLGLLSKVSDQARRAKLIFGADIPFWYSEPDEFTRRINTIQFGGSAKPIYQHVLDIVDNVAVMCYRTTSSGLDGVVAHSLGEIRYAQQAGKTVFVGLETGPVSDERILTFRGTPRLNDVNSLHGNHLFLIPTVDSLRFYQVSENQLGDFIKFFRALSNGRQTIYHWTTNSSVSVPGAKLSFETLGAEQFRLVMRETLLELGQYKSFAGFAVHHYDSYRILLGSSVH
jgi:hypothetical protein